MRNWIAISFVCILSFFSQRANAQFVSFNQIKNGKYEATIYYSSTTGEKSTYQLTVTVSNDNVTAIHFGNNGSVHTGYNNEGYTYYGGALQFSRDYEGNITGASTVIKVRYPNGTVQQFQVEI